MPEEPRKCILIVEDDISLGPFLRQGFEDRGYTAILASNIEKGRELFAREDPQIVLTDVQLPDGIGLLLAWALRQTGYSGVLAVMSASDYESIALNIGANLFHNKLMDNPRQLYDKIDELWRTMQ